jgi:hypothetical protein
VPPGHCRPALVTGLRPAHVLTQLRSLKFSGEDADLNQRVETDLAFPLLLCQLEGGQTAECSTLWHHRPPLWKATLGS